MIVQELIDKLNEIEDKSIDITMRGSNSHIIDITDIVIANDGKDFLCLINGDVYVEPDKVLNDLRAIIQFCQ